MEAGRRVLVSRHVPVSVPSPWSSTACFTCMSCFSLSPVLRRLLSVLDDKAVPAVPEDDGKLAVGPVLIHTLACVCLLLACRCSVSPVPQRGRGLHLSCPTCQPPSVLCRYSAWHGRPRRCMWIFECIFCAGPSHFRADGAAVVPGPRSLTCGHLQLQTACRQLSPRAGSAAAPRRLGRTRELA